jgi:hypothetical protein
VGISHAEDCATIYAEGSFGMGLSVHPRLRRYLRLPKVPGWVAIGIVIADKSYDLVDFLANLEFVSRNFGFVEDLMISIGQIISNDLFTIGLVIFAAVWLWLVANPKEEAIPQSHQPTGNGLATKQDDQAEPRPPADMWGQDYIRQLLTRPEPQVESDGIIWEREELASGDSRRRYLGDYDVKPLCPKHEGVPLLAASGSSVFELEDDFRIKDGWYKLYCPAERGHTLKFSKSIKVGDAKLKARTLMQSGKYHRRKLPNEVGE